MEQVSAARDGGPDVLLVLSEAVLVLVLALG
jgi:hypothetical protein